MNRSNNWLRLLGTAVVFMTGAVLNAQSTDTGAIKGRVTDDKGQPLPGAVIRAKGPQGSKGAEADSNGNYTIPFLTPGAYELSVTMDGYNTQVQPGVEVKIQTSVLLPFKLAAGSEVITVSGSRVRIDTTSSTSSTQVNLSQAIETFARPRDFTSAFDFSAGVSASSVGGGNPSITGATGLENQYIIGGVNVTNSGYGGLGAYDAVLGAQGSGVTTDFLENLEIREGGFEAEYGGALGGVITASIKSGTNDWKGAIAAYYEPRSMEGARRSMTQPGGFTNATGSNVLDIGLQVGGPIIKDKLFFFVAYNPTWTKIFNRLDIAQSDIAMDQVTLPNANREYDFGNQRVDNYAAHLTWNISEKHKVDLVMFGSPSKVDGIQRAIGRRTTSAGNNPTANVGFANIPITDTIAGASGTSKIDDRSLALSYFGTLTPWWNIEAKYAIHDSTVSETPGAGADLMLYTDIRRTQIFNRKAITPGATQITSPAQYGMGGYGVFQGDAHDRNTNFTIKSNFNFNAAGSHDLKVGVEFVELKFREDPRRSGPRGFDNGPMIRLQLGNDNSAVRIRTGTTISVRCNGTNPAGLTFGTACTTSGAGNYVYRATRGNFNAPSPDTKNEERNLFIQDKWQIKNVTLNLGLRWTSSEVSNPIDYTLKSVITGAPLVGNNGAVVGSKDELGNPLPGLAPGQFVGTAYKFKSELSPRLGISWDIMGNGKSKLSFNYSRIFERVPNDLAIRSFGNEFGLTRVNWSSPDLAPTSQLTAGGGRGANTVGDTSTVVEGGTRLPYKDDFAIGYSFELAPNFTVDLKANYRKQGRVLEDTQGVPVEAIQNAYYYLPYYLTYDPSGYYYTYDPAEAARRATFGCAGFGTYRLANVGENATTSYNAVGWTPTGCNGAPFTGKSSFGTPEQKYKGLSITLTKQANEGEHLSLQAVYRISRITGNYEGLYRSDNGQDDPNISSLYDFPDTVATRSQYFSGRLNGDIPHTLRFNASYRDMFIKNLTGAVTFKWQSGTPRTPYLAHPEYQNGGEIPGVNQQYVTIFGGQLPIMYKYDAVERGYLGRNPDVATWDVKLGYMWNLGKSNLNFDVFVENLFNNNDVVAFNDFVENQTGVVNPNYLRPLAAHAPRNIRLGVRWSF